jgi:hypothetical protein
MPKLTNYKEAIHLVVVLIVKFSVLAAINEPVLTVLGAATTLGGLIVGALPCLEDVLAAVLDRVRALFNLPVSGRAAGKGI